MWLFLRAAVLHRFTEKAMLFSCHWLSALAIQNLPNISLRSDLYGHVVLLAFTHYGGDSFNPNNIPGRSASKCFSKEIFLALGFVSW